MTINYDYPLATEENMKAVQEAIDAGTDIETIFSMFDEELLWDCYIVMSGQDGIVWQVFDWQKGNEQYRIEDWQLDSLENFLQESIDNASRRYLQ